MSDSRPDIRPHVDYLRISVTDRCNLRCTYCMPPEGVQPLRHEDILSYEEMLAVTLAATEVGVSKVRITGGEPLVRHGIVDFVGMLSQVPAIADLSLTTNALLLPKLAGRLQEAGLHRVNISIDSLRAERYATITRGGNLQDALAGLEAAFAAGFQPVKLNAVLQRGIEDDLDDFVQLVREQPVHVRFIEHMPLDRRHGQLDGFVPAGEVLDLLQTRHRIEQASGPYGNGPAQYWRPPGAPGTLGFIAGVSEHFCATCNRLRLTADGRLKTCLFSADEVDLRPYVGRHDELVLAIRSALATKTFDKRAETELTRRAMSQIGG